MKRETKETIAKMQRRPFSIVVDMYNIRRKDAAAVAARVFKTDGIEWIDYTPEDTETWTVIDDLQREWIFTKESSIVGLDQYKTRMISPQLIYIEDDLRLQDLMYELLCAGARSCGSYNCNVFISVDASDYDALNLRTLVNMEYSHEQLLLDAIDMSDHRKYTIAKPTDPFFVKVLNKFIPTSLDEFAEIWYRTQGCSDEKQAYLNPYIQRSYSFERNHPDNITKNRMLNLHSFFQTKKVEFRMFEFDHGYNMRWQQLRTFIHVCLAMTQTSKEVKSASPIIVKTQNPKYSLRTWLCHIGLHGSQFGESRAILLSKLDGNAVYKNFDDPNKNQVKAEIHIKKKPLDITVI